MSDELSGRRIGWLGTGRMGSTLVRRLLAGGCDVSVYNRTKAKAELLAAPGAKIVDSVAELAATDLVFVTVGTPQDLIEAVTGPAGLTSAAVAPRAVVDCSTVSAEASRQVREALAARGTELLAAPSMGNARVAAAGRRTFAVSGPRPTFDEVRPYLSLLGGGATYVGDGEPARSVKLCHNLFLGVVTQSLAEVTILAEKGGVKRAAFLEYLNRSVMGSTFTRYKAPALVNLDYHATFTSRLLHKDFDLGLQAASDFEVPMPVAALVAQIIDTLVNEGYGDEDFAALIALQARAAGIAIESENTDVPDGLSAL